MDYYKLNRLAIKKGDCLQPGDVVYVPEYILIGWGRYFSYPIWKKKTIAKISPNGASITFDDGKNIRQSNGYFKDIYKYDEEMEHETWVCETYKKIRKYFNKAKKDIEYFYLNESFFDNSEEEIENFMLKMIELCGIVKELKEKIKE